MKKINFVYRKNGGAQMKIMNKIIVIGIVSGFMSSSFMRSTGHLKRTGARNSQCMADKKPVEKIGEILDQNSKFHNYESLIWLISLNKENYKQLADQLDTNDPFVNALRNKIAIIEIAIDKNTENNVTKQVIKEIEKQIKQHRPWRIDDITMKKVVHQVVHKRHAQLLQIIKELKHQLHKFIDREKRLNIPMPKYEIAHEKAQIKLDFSDDYYSNFSNIEKEIAGMAGICLALANDLFAHRNDLLVDRNKNLPPHEQDLFSSALPKKQNSTLTIPVFYGNLNNFITTFNDLTSSQTSVYELKAHVHDLQNALQEDTDEYSKLRNTLEKILAFLTAFSELYKNDLEYYKLENIFNDIVATIVKLLENTHKFYQLNSWVKTFDSQVFYALNTANLIIKGGLERFAIEQKYSSATTTTVPVEKIMPTESTTEAGVPTNLSTSAIAPEEQKPAQNDQVVPATLGVPLPIKSLTLMNKSEMEENPVRKETNNIKQQRLSPNTGQGASSTQRSPSPQKATSSNKSQEQIQKNVVKGTAAQILIKTPVQKRDQPMTKSRGRGKTLWGVP